ncbi:hypothetical protein HZA73_05115 [candidate division TA06 bacterium]|nr:hypothetical protein [candidate division TA06 bacterium]
MEQTIAFKDRKVFRAWLQKNQDCGHSIWIEYYKDGRPGITYSESLEEALCFGWIDSTLKRVDDAVYIRKFVKRRAGSVWSVRNRLIAGRLIKSGKMTKWGIEAVNTAKSNGQWARSESEEITPADVAGLRRVISKKTRLSSFDKLGASRKELFARYYFDGKKEETRKARLDRIFEVMDGKRQLL